MKKQRKTTFQPKNPHHYAQTLILVNLILVNFFGFLVITRYHERFEGCHLVEIFPTDLPELSKPKFSRS